MTRVHIADDDCPHGFPRDPLALFATTPSPDATQWMDELILIARRGLEIVTDPMGRVA